MGSDRSKSQQQQSRPDGQKQEKSDAKGEKGDSKGEGKRPRRRRSIAFRGFLDFVEKRESCADMKKLLLFSVALRLSRPRPLPETAARARSKEGSKTDDSTKQSLTVAG